MLSAEVDRAPPHVLHGAGAPAARSPSSRPILRSPSGDCRGVEDRCVMQDVGARSVTSPAAQPILQSPFDECLSVKDSLAPQCVGPCGSQSPTRQPVSQSSFDECPGVTGTLVPQCVGNQSAQSATRHPFSQSPFAGGFNGKGVLRRKVLEPTRPNLCRDSRSRNLLLMSAWVWRIWPPPCLGQLPKICFRW